MTPLGKFYDSIKSYFNSIVIDSSLKPTIFVYDDKKAHITKIVDVNSIADDHLKILNNTPYIVEHIPVDGGLITWGQEKYISNNPQPKDGRPDCIIGNDNTMFYVELKTDIQCASNADKNCIKGMKQIMDFVLYLKSLPNIDYPLNQCALVCPKFEPKRHTNFLNKEEEFRVNTGLKIIFEQVYRFDI